MQPGGTEVTVTRTAAELGTRTLKVPGTTLLAVLHSVCSGGTALGWASVPE
jgi:hypothetical protein